MYRYNQPPDELRLPASLGLDVGPEADLVIAAWRQVILGFTDPADFVEEVKEQFSLPDGILTEAFEAVVAARAEQQAGFGEEAKTSLNAAFEALNEAGILALEGFSCCTDCGNRDIRDYLGPDSGYRGYVYYHAGDAEHLLDHGHVEISYGAALDQLIDRDEYEKLLPEGKQWWYEQVSVEFMRDQVLPILESHGIKVEWNREFDSRPLLTNVDYYVEL